MGAHIHEVIVPDFGNSNHLLPSNFSQQIVDLKYLLVQEIKKSNPAEILRRSRTRYRQNKPWSRKLSPHFERLSEESESEGYGTGTENGTHEVTKSKVLRKYMSSPYSIRKHPIASTNMSEIKGKEISNEPMDVMFRVNSLKDDHRQKREHTYPYYQLNDTPTQVEETADNNEISGSLHRVEVNDGYLGIGTEPMRNIVIVDRSKEEVEKIDNLLKKVPSLPDIHPPPLVPLSCGEKEILIYSKLRGIDQSEKKYDTLALNDGRETMENIRRYSQLKDTEIVDAPVVPQKSVPLHGSQAPLSKPPIMSPISCGEEEVLIYSPMPKTEDFIYSVDSIPMGYQKARPKHIPMQPGKIERGKEIHFDSLKNDSNMNLNEDAYNIMRDKDVEIPIRHHPNDTIDNQFPVITRPPPLSPLPIGECEVITYTPYKGPIDIGGNTYSIPGSEKAQANLFQIPPMSFEQGEIRTYRKYHRNDSSDSDDVSDRMSSSSSETEQLKQHHANSGTARTENIFEGYSVDSPDDTDGSLSSLAESEITQYILIPEEEAIVYRGENSSQLQYGDVFTAPTNNESEEFKYNTMRNAIRPGTVKALKRLFIKWQKQTKYTQAKIENVNPDLFEERRTADDILQANMINKENTCLSSHESDTESELNYQLDINSDNETRSPTAILNDETIIWKRAAKVGRTMPSDHRDDYDDFDINEKRSGNAHARSSSSDTSSFSGSGSPTEIVSDQCPFIRMSPKLESPALEIKPSLAKYFERSATILPETAWSRLDVILSSATETIIPQLVGYKKLTFDQNNVDVHVRSPISDVQDGDAICYDNSLVKTPCLNEHVVLPTNSDNSFTDDKYDVDTVVSSPVCLQENIIENVNNTEMRTNNDNTGKSTENTEMPRSVSKHTIQPVDATRSGQDYISEPAEPLLLTYITQRANNANISENHVAVDLTNITAEYGGEKVNLVKEKQTSYSLQRENERFKSQVDPDEETNENIFKNDAEEDRRTYQLPVNAASSDNIKRPEIITDDNNALVISPEFVPVNVQTDDYEHDVTSNAVDESARKIINADAKFDKSDANDKNISTCRSDSESIKKKAKPCSSTSDDTDSDSNSDTMSNHRVDKRHATSIPVGQTASFTVEEMSVSQTSFSPHVLSGIVNNKNSAYGDIVLIEDKQGGLYVVEDITETTSMGMMSSGEVSNQRAIEYTQSTDDMRNVMDFNTLTTVSSMDDYNTDSLYRRVYEGGDMTSGQAYAVTMDDSTLDSREYRETRNDQNPGMRIYDSYESQTIVQNNATPDLMNNIDNQQQAVSTMALISDINNQTTQMNFTTTQVPTVIQIPTVDPNAAYNSALLSSLLTTNINMMATPIQPPPPVFIPQPYPVFLEKNTTAVESPLSQRSLGVNTISSDVSSLSDNVLSTQNITQTEDVLTVFKSQQMDTQINTSERTNLSEERVIEKEPVYRSTIEIHNLNNSVANDITMETEKPRKSTPQFTIVKSRMSHGSNSTPLDHSINAHETQLDNRSENRDWSSETNQGFTKIYHSGQTEYTKETKHSQQRDSHIKSTDSNKSQLHVNFNTQPVPLNVNLHDNRDHISTSDTSQNHQYRIVKATSSQHYDEPSDHQVIYREITEQSQPSVMSRTATEEVRQTTRTVNGIDDHDDRYNVRNYRAADAKAVQNGDFLVRRGRRQRHGSGSSSDSSVSSFSSGEFKRNIKVNVERKNPHVIVDIHIPEKYKGNVVHNYNREEHSESRQIGGGTSDRMMRDSGYSGAAQSSVYQSSSHTTSGVSSQQRHGVQNSYKDDYNRNRGRRISSSDDEEVRKSQRKVTRTVKESTETSPQYRVVRTTTSSNYDTARNQTNNDANVFSDHYYVRKENNAYGRRSRSPSPATDEEVRNKRIKEVYKVTTFQQKPKGHDMNQNQSYMSEKRTTLNASVPTYSNDSQYREVRTTTHSTDYAKQDISADRDLKVVRGSFLINNQMSRHSDEHDNVNLFDSSFRMSKSNPLYQSDQDIYRKTEEEQEMTEDITYETVSKIVESKQMAQATSKHGKQTLSELLLARISNIDSKDISQTIDVQHHHEDIYGGINFIHADGTRMEGDNTENFDAIGENVELQLKDRKAIVEIRVTAERIVPIDYEFNVWRKSSAVVTRHIEIDLGATEQRRKLYDHVMRTAGRQDAIGSTVGGTRYGNQAVLNSKETLRVFSQILNAAEGDTKNDQASSRQGISNVPAFFY